MNGLSEGDIEERRMWEEKRDLRREVGFNDVKNFQGLSDTRDWRSS